MSSKKFKNATRKVYLPLIQREVFRGHGISALDGAKLIRQGKMCWPFPSKEPSEAFVDRSNTWVVMVWDETATNGTPWEGSKRVGVRYFGQQLADGNPDPRSQTAIMGDAGWESLQEIKEWLFPGRFAVEVYPPKTSEVNVSEMRWLFVLPASITEFPFDIRKPADAGPTVTD